MNETQTHREFSYRMIHLISEPGFILFENILHEPNFFSVVGRSHYERWHSSFLGWLLDPNGSHLLSHYPLKRFLGLLLHPKSLYSVKNVNETLLDLLPIIELSNVNVAPNEYTPREKSVPGVGKFDIFLTADFCDGSSDTRRINIIVELKISSKPSKEQAQKYADWLLKNRPNDLNLLVYLIPDLDKSSKATVGDERWYCLDYQLLNDGFLLPLIDHPNLNDKAKPIIFQYIKNLRIRYRGVKMAITDEEKQMAIALYEKYSDVFDAIYDVLVSTGTIDFTTSDIRTPLGRSSGTLAVQVDGKLISSETLRELFNDFLKYVVDNKLIDRLPLPWGTTIKRYIITCDSPPLHPTGRAFFYPVEYKGYILESHYARDRGLKVLGELCEELEIEFEILIT